MVNGCDGIQEVSRSNTCKNRVLQNNMQSE